MKRSVLLTISLAALCAILIPQLLQIRERMKSAEQYDTIPIVYVYGIPYFTNTEPSDLEDRKQFFTCIGQIDTENGPSDTRITSKDEPTGAKVYYSASLPELIYTEYQGETHVYTAQLARKTLVFYQDALYIARRDTEASGDVPPISQFEKTNDTLFYRYLEYIPRDSCEANRDNLRGEALYASTAYPDYLYTKQAEEDLLLIKTSAAEIPAEWWGWKEQ